MEPWPNDTHCARVALLWALADGAKQPLRIVSGDIAASFDSQRPRFGMLWSAAFSARFAFGASAWWCEVSGP